MQGYKRTVQSGEEVNEERHRTSLQIHQHGKGYDTMDTNCSEDFTWTLGAKKIL